MGLEIEVKAHLTTDMEVASAKAFLANMGKDHHTIDKVDLYYKGPFVSPVRIRAGQHVVVTSKVKSQLPDGTEVNKETEFELNNSDVPSFVQWIGTLGFQPLYAKTKKGFGASYKETLIEVVQVGNAGWFVEVETVIPEDASEEERAAASKLVQSVLKKMKIPAKNQEKQSYTALLGAPKD